MRNFYTESNSCFDALTLKAAALQNKPQMPVVFFFFPAVISFSFTPESISRYLFPFPGCGNTAPNEQLASDTVLFSC
jgi:hypothetical protein